MKTLSLTNEKKRAQFATNSYIRGTHEASWNLTANLCPNLVPLFASNLLKFVRSCAVKTIYCPIVPEFVGILIKQKPMFHVGPLSIEMLRAIAHETAQEKFCHISRLRVPIAHTKPFYPFKGNFHFFEHHLSIIRFQTRTCPGREPPTPTRRTTSNNSASVNERNNGGKFSVQFHQRFV